MIDSIMESVEGLMGSQWIYLAIFTIAALDAFFPVVPSETLVITSGVFAATGDPQLLLVVAAAAGGAFVGDHISYFIGRFAGVRLRNRTKPGSKTRKAFDWAEHTLQRRGGLILVIARYIPGGRTATTLTMGTVGYPLRWFTFFDAIAATSWAWYSALIGYIGGRAFEEDPFKGLLVGLGVAVGITVIVESVRYLRERRAKARAATTAEELTLTARDQEYGA